jgi:hypothetical protein
MDFNKPPEPFMINGSLCITDINREIKSLGILDSTRKHIFTLRNEGAVNDFLGIHIQQIDKYKFQLTQVGLIEKILRSMKLEDCNGCDTQQRRTHCMRTFMGKCLRRIGNMIQWLEWWCISPITLDLTSNMQFIRLPDLLISLAIPMPLGWSKLLE